MSDCARYNVSRSGEGWEANETSRLVGGVRMFCGPSSCRHIEAGTKDGLWTKMRAAGGTRNFRRRSKWRVLYGGPRDAED